jgi:hypothetical protein
MVGVESLDARPRAGIDGGKKLFTQLRDVFFDLICRLKIRFCGQFRRF